MKTRKLKSKFDNPVIRFLKNLVKRKMQLDFVFKLTDQNSHLSIESKSVLNIGRFDSARLCFRDTEESNLGKAFMFLDLEVGFPLEHIDYKMPLIEPEINHQLDYQYVVKNQNSILHNTSPSTISKIELVSICENQTHDDSLVQFDIDFGLAFHLGKDRVLCVFSDIDNHGIVVKYFHDKSIYEDDFINKTWRTFYYEGKVTNTDLSLVQLDN